VANIADGGIYQSSVLKARQGFLAAQDAQSWISQLPAAYLAPEDVNHRFRVLESLVPRAKQPGAICLLQ